MTLELTPWRRGDRRTEQVTIRASGPLGLWARQATLAAPGRVRVLPPFHSRAHLPSRLTRLRELDGRTPLLIRGQGTEFDSIREYVRGDDVRSIDWRATARHADPEVPGSTRLMVRTWRPERDRRIVIVADTSRTAAARIADEPRLDTAWEASLLLAALASHAGDRVDFLAWDRRLRGRVHGSSGAELLARMVDTMAGIDAELIEADWASVPGQVRRVTSRHALVVLLDGGGLARQRPRAPLGAAAAHRPAHRRRRIRRRPCARGVQSRTGFTRRGVRRRGSRTRPPRRRAGGGGDPTARRDHRDGPAARAAPRPRRPVPRTQGRRPALGGASAVGAFARLSRRRYGSRPRRTRRGRRSRRHAPRGRRARACRRGIRRGRAHRCRSSPATATAPG